jgi:hypothetical protein
VRQFWRGIETTTRSSLPRRARSLK